ncbi:MAG: HprK-related kinase A [Betaproteobacteria bacterium]
MIVADLSPSQLGERLAGDGLWLQTGPVRVRIKSGFHRVANGIALHYGAHSVDDNAQFADFHVSLTPAQNFRRWLRPQVFFHVDGDPPFKPLPADQAFPMLEWGLNWCLSNHCHQYLIIHAAVIERNGRALLLPAPPGSGKSTLCAGLIHRGWRLLSDELALIDPATAALHPIPRPVSLKNNSIEVIRRFAPDAVLGPIVHETTKGQVAHMQPPQEAIRRSAESAMPGWIVLPRYEPDSPPRLEGLSRGNAFMQLAENAFNYNLHGRLGFEALGRVIDNSACYRFSYSRLEDAVEIFDDLAEQGGIAL